MAFHMACELMRAGVKVAGVVLIDSPSPYTQKPLPEELIEAVLEAETVGANEQQANLVRLARIQMTHSTNTLVAYNPPSPSEYSALPNVTMIRCSDSFPLSDIAGINKSKRLSFLEDRKDPKDLVRDWERLVGKEVPIFDIPGHHFEVFSPSNVSLVSRSSLFIMSNLLNHFHASLLFSLNNSTKRLRTLKHCKINLDHRYALVALSSSFLDMKI